MPLWDKVKQELDRAGQVAQDALDEGRIRLEVHRIRQLADKAAQNLGYAVYRARAAGTPADDAELARHSAALAAHEAEATRLETQLNEIQQRWRASGASDAGATAPSGVPPVDPTPASATTTPSPETADAPVPPPMTPPGSDTPTTDPWRPGDVPGKEPY